MSLVPRKSTKQFFQTVGKLFTKDYDLYKGVVEDTNKEMLKLMQTGEVIQIPLIGKVGFVAEISYNTPVDWKATKALWAKLEAESRMPEKKPVVKLKNRESGGLIPKLKIHRKGNSMTSKYVRGYKAKLIRTDARRLVSFFRETDFTKFKRKV